jgi:hypothetical protein
MAMETEEQQNSSAEGLYYRCQFRAMFVEQV